MKLFYKSCIEYDDVTDENKLKFLNQEAKRVAAVLRTKPFKVTMSETVVDYDVNSYEIFINPDMDLKTATAIVLNAARQLLWDDGCDMVQAMIDCTVFTAAYFVYVHGFEACDLMVDIPFNKKLSEKINALIQTEWVGHIMFDETEEHWILRTRRMRYGKYN